VFWQADTSPVVIGKKNSRETLYLKQTNKQKTEGQVHFGCPSPPKPGEDHAILS